MLNLFQDLTLANFTEAYMGMVSLSSLILVFMS